MGANSTGEAQGGGVDVNVGDTLLYKYADDVDGVNVVALVTAVIMDDECGIFGQVHGELSINKKKKKDEGKKEREEKR